jgi:hypothetical protein
LRPQQARAIIPILGHLPMRLHKRFAITNPAYSYPAR